MNEIENRAAGEQLLERRVYDVVELRTRRDDDGKRTTLVGHAAVFNKMSVDMWGFREQVAKGAFSKTLKKDDIRALWNHNPEGVFGRNKSKTLRLSEDEVGLAIEIDMPDTQLARDAIQLIDRGDVSQMSFGFRTVTDQWHMQDSKMIRTLVEVKLFDVSPVTFPAYPDTDISVRSADVNAALRSLEAWKKSQDWEGHNRVLSRRLDVAGL